MTGATLSDWRTAEEKARDIAQARALREPARKGGLRFEAYLPPALADWVLDLVERGVFADPGEAVFVMLGEQRDLEPHADLRQECLKRSLEAALRDPRPGPFSGRSTCAVGQAGKRTASAGSGMGTAKRAMTRRLHKMRLLTFRRHWAHKAAS